MRGLTHSQLCQGDHDGICSSMRLKPGDLTRRAARKWWHGSMNKGPQTVCPLLSAFPLLLTHFATWTRFLGWLPSLLVGWSGPIFLLDQSDFQGMSSPPRAKWWIQIVAYRAKAWTFCNMISLQKDGLQWSSRSSSTAKSLFVWVFCFKFLCSRFGHIPGTLAVTQARDPCCQGRPYIGIGLGQAAAKRQKVSQVRYVIYCARILHYKKTNERLLTKV